MIRFLPILFFLIVIVGLFLYLPARREIAYRLHLSGDETLSCCKVSEILKSSGDFDESASVAIFNGQIIDYPKTSLAQAYSNSLNSRNSAVLGTTNAEGAEKWIEVDLANQKLTAWEGNRKAMEFLVSSGKWAPTPTGTFEIWYKTRNQSMIGGSQALGTYYNLPNVPNNMFFYKGYAIHGAYWHNNFGQPMSHGCVNSPLANAAAIFEWAGPVVPADQNSVRASAENPGTRVWVH